MKWLLEAEGSTEENDKTLAELEESDDRSPREESIQQMRDILVMGYAHRCVCERIVGLVRGERTSGGIDATDYEWQLIPLVAVLHDHRLPQITISEVDRYRTHKTKGTLSAASINKTITRLAQVLEVAVEYGLIERNPAKASDLRFKTSRPAPVWLDSAEQVEALLDAAGELDREAKSTGRYLGARCSRR